MASKKPHATASGSRSSALVSNAAALVSRSQGGQFTLSKREGWVAIPVESVAHFGRHHVQRLHNAWREYGCGVASAVLLEPLRGVPEVKEIVTTVEGLTEFSRSFAHFNVVLVTASPNAAVICTTDDYFVVAGPESFVTVAVGGAIAEAYERFASFFSHPAWTEKARSFFSSVFTALRDEYPLLEAGESLTFPRES
jgi:hypothetical protein